MRGCSEQQRPVQTNIYGHRHGSRESLFGGYTSYEFVTAEHTCALKRLCIQPPLYKGGSWQSPRLESTLDLNPILISYWLECQSVCRYTPPAVPVITEAFHHRTTTVQKMYR